MLERAKRLAKVLYMYGHKTWLVGGTVRDMLLNKEVVEHADRNLYQNWGDIKGTLPVASGGLHPGVLPEVMEVYGTTDMALQVGGGIHGHPDGSHAGAKATVQALEAIRDDMTLEDKAETHKELKSALDKWGYIRPV